MKKYLKPICYITLVLQTLIYLSLAFISVLSNVNKVMSLSFMFYVFTLLILMMTLDKHFRPKKISAFLLILSHAFMYLGFDRFNGLAYLLFAFYWFLVFLKLQKQELPFLKKARWVYMIMPMICLVVMVLLTSEMVDSLALLGLETIASMIIAYYL